MRLKPSVGNREGGMISPDWASLYAPMDKRIDLKYQQLPKGEQIGLGPKEPHERKNG